MPTVLDLLFPPRCVLCSTPPDTPETLLCDGCAASIKDERAAPACPRCAASVAPYESSRGRCSACRRRPVRVQATVRVGPDRRPIPERDAGHCIRSDLGTLVRLYKYHARQELGPLLGAWLAEAVTKAPWIDRLEGIVSVPTHWKRRIHRPFHAADALATIAAGAVNLPHLPVLRRKRAGSRQIGLTYEERVRNVRGAFALRRGAKLRGTRLLLVDDVKTTGATINECAKVLREGGAAEVYAAIVVQAGWNGDVRLPLRSI